jgi:hypothetical protein
MATADAIHAGGVLALDRIIGGFLDLNGFIDQVRGEWTG